MEWIEVKPLPSECQNCQEKECYNCDYACKRWHLSQTDELKLKRMSILKKIQRLERQLEAVNAELEELENE